MDAPHAHSVHELSVVLQPNATQEINPIFVANRSQGRTSTEEMTLRQLMLPLYDSATTYASTSILTALLVSNTKREKRLVYDNLWFKGATTYALSHMSKLDP